MSGEFASLSRREEQILGLLCSGLADKEVAAQLGIATATVRTYVARLEAKLGAENRTQLGAVGQSGSRAVSRLALFLSTD